ncbi:MAG TPA: di-trans,poly-cis-decaprenylcistransferase [Candidatus Thalassarchaeaceae archaeon]|nr:polyprenyl diphosphate synthase [Candidatus Thalassarchaeaceae archaeon]DAC51575.1 MAG TPA: di-trans,poly-cis-decaprenylcistransferase [Candidatus Poseidoniales archaeon]HIH82624.1 di-trans,poly-cis-decaprenylcistransferase [Candidatus Thalassarchaeaceae archaeon]|tara:strand:+ start:4119 stop:4988 length:870 start_codon:yes stop_codon:yes gene_type:complete
MGRIGKAIDSTARWLLKWRIIRGPARFIANSRYAYSIITRTDRVRTNRLRDRLKKGVLPKHISIIMDGNRRFAWSQDLDKKVGHRHGKDKLKEVLDWVLDLGIPYLTVYALSTENVSGRDIEELGELYELYINGFDEIRTDSRIHDNNVRVNAVGRLELLPKDVQDAIKRAKDDTADYDDFLFTICLAYGGREEIVDAMRDVAQDHAKGVIALEDINTETISNRLYTADLPDPDLVIRTSGEERISNFLLWQIAYSELHFTDVHWPSFSRNDLYDAINSYQKRKRRYGG